MCVEIYQYFKPDIEIQITFSIENTNEPWIITRIEFLSIFLNFPTI